MVQLILQKFSHNFNLVPVYPWYVNRVDLELLAERF